MAVNDALDRRLIELALEQHRDSRRAFHRDLRIACAILLTFQCLLFFRFLQVADERAHLADQLQQLEQDQIALDLVREHVLGVDATLKPLRSEFQHMPADFQNQLAVIESFRASANDGCVPGIPCSVDQDDAPGNNTPIQLPLDVTGTSPTLMVGTPVPLLIVPPVIPPECQSPLVGYPASPTAATPVVTSSSGPPDSSAVPTGVLWVVSYLDQLSEADRRLLAAGAPNEEYQALVERIVDEAIIQPMFADLNATKDKILAGNFLIAKQQLCVTLYDHSDMLRRNGLPDPAAVLNEILTVEDKIREHRIEPPPLKSWWRTYTGKGAVAESMDADVMAFSSALGYPSEQLQLVSGELQQLTDRLNIDQANLEDKLAGLESQFAQVHGTFQQLASPMSGIPVELKYAVLYYPVILATVFASFVGRYVLDRARARQLVPLVRRLGVSTEALDVYLADYSIRSNRQGNVAGPSIVPAFVLAVIVPGVLFAVSVAWIVSSQVFVEDRGWYVGLYVLAAAMMAGGYWALIGERLWQTIRRSSIRRNGDTA